MAPPRRHLHHGCRQAQLLRLLRACDACPQPQLPALGGAPGQQVALIGQPKRGHSAARGCNNLRGEQVQNVGGLVMFASKFSL